MQGFDVGQVELLDTDAWAGHMLEQGSTFALLAAERRVLFPDSMFEDLFPSSVGRRSVPGSTIASIMVLQVLEGLSDREVTRALTFDLRWKAACGLAITDKGIHPTSLTLWRKRLAASDRPNRIFDAVVDVVERSGVLAGRRRRALDSTILFDAVQTQDTITQLVSQIRRVAKTVPGAGDIVAGLEGHDYSSSKKPLIDWDDRQARQDLVSMLVEHAKTVLSGIDTEGLDELQSQQVGLLALVAGQDVEPAEGSDGSDGRWRIARRVAKDRVISVVDPEARHARKSMAKKMDGFKAHVAVEPDMGIVTDCMVTKVSGKGSSDSAAGEVMLRNEPTIGVEDDVEILGDSGYGSAGMLSFVQEAGYTPVIKPLPLRAPIEGGFTVDDFTFDSAQGTASCPAGRTVTVNAAGNARFGRFCQQCPLKASCTRAKNGRVLSVSQVSVIQREHRARAKDPGFRETYRTHRPMVERTIAFMTRKGRRVPYRGVTKNDAWWRLRAAGVNLKLLARMGLNREHGAWAIG